jgi:hypothetical protein
MTQNQANFIVISALFGAILIGIFTYIQMVRHKPQRYSLREHLGKSEWDFSKSWATNVTLFGALLYTILGSQFGGNLVGYAGISQFFGILVVVAPFLYNATTQPCLDSLKGEGKYSITTSQGDQKQDQDKQIEHHGLVWAFLISSILTLWAVFGQLETIWSLLGGPTLQKFFTPLVTYLFQTVVGLSILLVIYYGFTTIYETVREQVAEDTINTGAPIVTNERVKEELKKSIHTRKAIHPL